jgi:mono/diheme cytochrome c family protein
MDGTRNVLRLTVTLAAVLAAACGGREKAPPQQTAQVPASVSAAGSDKPDGAAVFVRCATCHQPTGLGTPGVFPPLAGSSIANGPASIPIRIVMRGLTGSVTVKGQEFNGVMPAYGVGVEMTDAEIAAVLTHVRSSFGNRGGAVTPAEVARERAAIATKTGPWTAAELGIK